MNQSIFTKSIIDAVNKQIMENAEPAIQEALAQIERRMREQLAASGGALRDRSHSDNIETREIA